MHDLDIILKIVTMDIRNKFKNYSKISTFLLLILMSCEEGNFNEQYVDDEQHTKFVVKTVELSKIKLNNQLFSKIKSINTGINDDLNRIISNNDFSINTELARYVSNGERHSYTFPLVRISPSDNKLENLLLVYNEQNTYDAYIVKYEFSEEELIHLDLKLLLSDKKFLNN